MAKKLKKAPSNKNKLIAALEAGKKIVGMEGFIRAQVQGGNDWDSDDDLESGHPFVAVIVKGLFTANNCDGVRIEVAPIEGFGSWVITPCAWYEDLDQIKRVIQEEKENKYVADLARNLSSDWSLPRKRAKVIDYIETMKDEDKKNQLIEHIKEKYSGLQKIPGHKLTEIVSLAIRLNEGLPVELPTGNNDDY